MTKGIFCLDKAITLGLVLLFKAISQHSSVSIVSAGLNTFKFGIALKSITNPSVIALSRQKLPFITEVLTNKNMSSLGGYELKKNNSSPEVTLIASGSEVQIAIDAFNKLQNIGIKSKVVSMPCQELFDKQSQEYKEKVIEKNSIKISIEASNIFGWEKYVGTKGISLGVESFGKSAPYSKIYKHFNLTADNVVKTAKKMLDK